MFPIGSVQCGVFYRLVRNNKLLSGTFGVVSSCTNSKTSSCHCRQLRRATRSEDIQLPGLPHETEYGNCSCSVLLPGDANQVVLINSRQRRLYLQYFAVLRNWKQRRLNSNVRTKHTRVLAYGLVADSNL